MRKSSRTCLHTIAPEGYLQWHAWAEEMAKTHEQQQCTACGLWAIWARKAKTPKGPLAGAGEGA